jgi:hypothetical protein
VFELLQKSLYSNGSIRRAVCLPAGGFNYWFFGLSRSPGEAEELAKTSRSAKNRRQGFGVWQGSTEKLVTRIWINPISLSVSKPCLEVRSGGKQIYPV